MIDDICSSCGASIRWARTALDESIPLDVEPVDGGNVEITPDGRALVVQPDQLGLFGTPPRFVSHFATCPHADEHRRRKVTR